MRINQNAQPGGIADDRVEKQKDEPQRAQRTAPKIREEKSLRAFAETLRRKPTTSCFSTRFVTTSDVVYSSSSRRDEMFIERKFKKIFLAPEERNVADLAYSSPQTLRSADSRSASRGIICVSINVRLLRSQCVVWLQPRPRCVLCG